MPKRSWAKGEPKGDAPGVAATAAVAAVAKVGEDVAAAMVAADPPVVENLTITPVDASRRDAE